MDPTGTPLNVRATPNGEILRRVPNGLQVSIIMSENDSRGRPWAFIVRQDNGHDIGWVFREFLSCF
jgi:hypothetical protein